MAKVKFDLRIASIITLMKKAEKTIMTNEVKEAIRNDEVETIGNTYGTINLTDYTSTKYKDKEGNEISQADIIKAYCKEHEIEVIKETKENYKVEIVPSKKAETIFKQMITILEEDQDSQVIARIASILNNKINKG